MPLQIQADDFYSVMSHPMRLRSVVLLHQAGELCVCEIMHSLDLQQPVASRHLAQLKAAGILESRKAGLWVYYTINSQLPKWVLNSLNETFKGIARQSPYVDDFKLLNNMQDRPASECC